MPVASLLEAAMRCPLTRSEDSDVVGMKAVPQTQGPRAMNGYITPAFSGSP